MSARVDEWASVAALVRRLRDCVHFLGPAFAGASAVRTRIFVKLRHELGLAADEGAIRAAFEALPQAQLARVDAVLRLVERSIPTSNLFDEFLRSEEPDVALICPLVHFGSAQADVAASARGLGIPVWMLAYSWDNLSTKGCLHVEPDLAAAAYFKTFVRQRGDAYVWNYGGARPNTPSRYGVVIEDTDHAHIDLSLVITAHQFGLGGLTDVDMHRLAGTVRVVLNDGAGVNNVWKFIDGTVPAGGPWDRASVGYDWIELADYDPTLFEKTVKVFNQYLSAEEGSRFYLGWAEIQRKRNCTEL